MLFDKIVSQKLHNELDSSTEKSPAYCGHFGKSRLNRVVLVTLDGLNTGCPWSTVSLRTSC